MRTVHVFLSLSFFLSFFLSFSPSCKYCRTVYVLDRTFESLGGSSKMAGSAVRTCDDDDFEDARHARKCTKADENSKVPRVASGRVASRRVAPRHSALRSVFCISCRVSRCVLAHRTWRVATSHCAPGERGAAAPLHPSKPPPSRPVCHPCRDDDAPPPPPAARYYRLPPRGCGASAYSHTTDPARPCSIYLPVPESERDDDGLT